MFFLELKETSQYLKGLLISTAHGSEIQIVLVKFATSLPRVCLLEVVPLDFCGEFGSKSQE